MDELMPFGAASARQLRPHRNMLPRLVASGLVVKPFPGVYAQAARMQEAEVRIRAAALWLSSGVVIGEAARVLHSRVEDPFRSVGCVELATRAGVTAPPGIRVCRVVPAEVEELAGIRVAGRAWNAVWLAARDEGAAIDEFMRDGGTHAELEEAMSSLRGCTGAAVRRQLVDASATNPWSGGERALHRLLVGAGITGWRANARVWLRGPGAARGDLPQSYIADVLFEEERLVVEFDGYRYHGDRLSFEADRFRQAELVAAGWRVLRFTWAQVSQQPEWVVACLRRALSTR